eukprot:TRINITY_DN67478_c3_g10_i1.p1 TRINITY_DN67478_c3_g10~~TRINITY_DN67478_c3_g10_i1.p1  ORF type:complete len:404 (+),score=94.15 TRINITY_DN67478_c3_g10_i1:64-1212(+)
MPRFFLFLCIVGVVLGQSWDVNFNNNNGCNGGNCNCGADGTKCLAAGGFNAISSAVTGIHLCNVGTRQIPCERHMQIVMEDVKSIMAGTSQANMQAMRQGGNAVGGEYTWAQDLNTHTFYYHQLANQAAGQNVDAFVMASGDPTGGVSIETLARNTALSGGGFITYPWNNADASIPAQTKISYISPAFYANGMHMAVGSGFNAGDYADGSILATIQVNSNWARYCTDSRIANCENRFALIEAAAEIVSTNPSSVVQQRATAVGVNPNILNTPALNPDPSTGAYIFVFDFNFPWRVYFHGRSIDGTLNANPTAAEFVTAAGQPTDADLGALFHNIAAKGGGWVLYTWNNAVNGPTFRKMSYIMPVRDTDGAMYFVGAGFDTTV